MQDFIVASPKLKKIKIIDGKGIIPDSTELIAEVDYKNVPQGNSPTPINKATLLADSTAALYNLSGSSATVNNVLAKGSLINYNVGRKGESLRSLTSLSSARGGVTGVSNNNGKVVFAGGRERISGASNVVEAYDASGTKTTYSPLSVAVEKPAGGRVNDNSVIFAGGMYYNSSTTNYTVGNVYLYNNSGSCTTLASLSYDRNQIGAATDGNDRLVLAGGARWNNNETMYDIVERYDCYGSRSYLSSLPMPTKALVGATDGNGCVLFAGGRANVGLGTADAVYRYDLKGNVTTLSPLPAPHYEMAAGTDGNGNVIFAGGLGGSEGYSSVVTRYDKYGSKTSLTGLSQGRAELCGVSDGGGNVLFAGGVRAYNCVPTNVVDKYNTSGTRTTLTSLSSARYAIAGGKDGNGDVMFAGGYTDHMYAASSSAEKYETSYTFTADIKGTKVWFEGMSSEQVITGTTNIKVKTPCKGYVRFGGSVNL